MRAWLQAEGRSLLKFHQGIRLNRLNHGAAYLQSILRTIRVMKVWLYFQFGEAATLVLKRSHISQTENLKARV